MQRNIYTRDNYYYKVTLEVALKDSDYVFGSINISHISYSKLDELFRSQVTYERFLFDDSLGYMIDQDLYNQHKDFFDKEIPFTFDFNLFEYSVGFSGDVIEKYQKDYYEELPPLFDKEA